MNNVKIVPYVEVDGIRTFQDSTIIGLFERVVSDGIFDTIFYEGTVDSKEAFLTMMKGNGAILYLLLIEKEIIGFVWLNRFEGKTAHLHFCTFKNTWGTGKNVGIGRFTLRQLINMGCFDLFVGWLPVWNTHAINFVKACGAKTAGIIPNAVFNSKSGKSEPAEFIYLTREDLE